MHKGIQIHRNTTTNENAHVKFISYSLALHPCWKRVKANKARFGNNTPADFVNPSCDKDGYFTPVQCRPLMGCYCVDEYGNRIPKRLRSFIPDCRRLIQDTKQLTTVQPTKLPTTQVQPTTKGNVAYNFQIFYGKKMVCSCAMR